MTLDIETVGALIGKKIITPKGNIHTVVGDSRFSDANDSYIFILETGSILKINDMKECVEVKPKKKVAQVLMKGIDNTYAISRFLYSSYDEATRHGCENIIEFPFGKWIEVDE
jgi:hypothetical protein